MVKKAICGINNDQKISIRKPKGGREKREKKKEIVFCIFL